MIDIPFDRLIFTLRLHQPLRLHFHHGFIVHGLLALGADDRRRRDAVQGDADPEGMRGIAGFDCEAGRVAFDSGATFNLGVTLAGPSREHAGRIAENLARLGHLACSGLGSFEVTAARNLPQPGLREIAGAIRGTPSVRLRLISPLRLSRPKYAVRNGQEWMDGDWFAAAHFLDRLWSRLRKLETGAWPKDAAGRPPLPPATDGGALRLSWLDLSRTPIGSAPVPRERRRSKLDDLGGAVGGIDLGPVDPQWADLLALGQFLHLGEQTHYGLGAWRVDGGPPFADFQPSVSFLSEVAEENNLAGAAKHVLDEAGSEEQIELTSLRRELKSGTYRSGSLSGFLHQKEGEKVRPLAVPNLRDRIAQRAAVQVLAPAIDTLLEDCSWAYRKGLSRAGAARAIQQAYREGYTYVLDADIESFFDSVDWERMLSMLRAWFPLDPVDALVQPWITAPVVFDGQTIERAQGLPQGAPISPLLANLYLDVFDEKLLEQGFRLVRYADDFVILCRTIEAAEAARDAARNALAELELQLSEEKTSIRSLDQGLTYLGYLFCRSVVLDASHGEAGTPDAATRIPPRSWLASLPIEEIEQLLLEGGKVKRLRPPPVRLMERQPEGELRSPLYVLSPATSLRLEQGAVRIEGGGHTERRLLKEIAHVVFFGEPRGTLPLMLALARQGVPLFLCDAMGRLEAMTSPYAPDQRIWLAQARFTELQEPRSDFIREIVAAKLRAYAAVARRLLQDAEAGEALRALEQEVWNKSAVDSVRGVEGRGGAVWFAALQKALPVEWHFNARKRHPAPDPVNAMLSLAYSILYHHAAAALIAAGLTPAIGIYHEQREGTGWNPLAADLQEELRHLGDRVVLTLIRKGQITPAQFESSEGRCIMDSAARGSVVAEMKRRLSVTFTPAEGVTITWREAISRQAQQIRELVTGRRGRYVPLESPK